VGRLLPRDGLGWLLFALGALSLGNAAWMLIDPFHWYRELPAGVPDFGPFNPHFVRDIGCAYLTAGVALVWAALAPRRRVALVAIGLLFYAAHAACVSTPCARRSSRRTCCWISPASICRRSCCSRHSGSRAGTKEARMRLESIEQPRGLSLRNRRGDTRKASDAIFEAQRKQCSEQEIVEITALALRRRGPQANEVHGGKRSAQ
jgi:hypothetical protein